MNKNKENKISYTVDNTNEIEIKVSGGSFNPPYYDFKDSDGNTINIALFRFMRGRTYKFIADGISANHPFKINLHNSVTY